MCVKLSPGKAYVRGFDISLPGTTVVDVEKPRDTKNVKSASIPFDMGSIIKVNNVSGSPFVNIGGNTANVVELRGDRKGSSAHVAAGLQVGEARVYSYNVSDAPYTGTNTNFDLHLYDIQTFTILKCTEFNSGLVPKGSRVRGLASGAIGYAAKDGDATGNNEICLSQTTGTFVQGEQLIINERTSSAKFSIKEVITYTSDDIKSIRQDTFGTTGISTFNADTLLYDRVLPFFSITDQLNVVNNTVEVLRVLV